MLDSLWGEEFVVPETPKRTKKIIEKVSNPKTPIVVTQQAIKSKSTNIEEKLTLIKENVLRILGVYKENTIVIKTKEELINYIDKAINNGIIAIDTETNNSLDPITCKLMGPCIYTPGMKNAYIPLNHVDVHTKERFSWQLTEEDIAEQFNRLSDTKIIMHNGKFDYQVIKCTTGVELSIYWDTLIGSRLLDENERANLKMQYISKIDSSIEKYDIEHLFEHMEYAIVEPEIFALYAATDAFMTYKLYEWQKVQFEKPEHSKMFKLFLDVEMPIVTVAAEMELTGIEIDHEYAKRLSDKYHKKLANIDTQIQKELSNYDKAIAQWRLTEDANFHPVSTKPSKDGTFKQQKSKNEQLETPISVTSPTQLAILFYDVLKVGVVDKKSPRGTGEEILQKIDLPLCKLILEKRGLEKLIGTYIDKLPKCVSEKDNRLHAHFNQIGADCITGDSAIMTPNGVYRMDDILNNSIDNEYKEFTYSLINENNEIENTSHCIRFDNVDTIKIRTLYGYELEGTPNHPIRVLPLNINQLTNTKKKPHQLQNAWDNIQWKTLSEISHNDLVVIDTHKYELLDIPYIPTNFDPHITGQTHIQSSKMPTYIDEEFSEFLGMLHADGSLKYRSGCWKVILSNGHEDVINRFEYLCNKLFELNIQKEWSNDNTITGYSIHGPKLAQLSKYFITGKANKHRIPQEIFHSRDSVFFSYLKGLSLDSGCQGKEQLTYSLMNEYDCKAIQQRLLKHGILAPIRLHRTKKMPNVNVIIRTEDLSKFIELTGPLFRKSSYKEIKLTKKATRFYKNGDLIALPVKDIIYSTNTVYDFTLPKTHSFLANGFICHNTGRFSSSDPNLQNIPSHEKSIRMMFKAASGHVLVGSDFSQQEPRLLSNYAQDENMINAYKEGKDLYATIAAGVYNNTYWDNMEHYEDGTPNPEGKKRRSSCKSLLLGIMYGRGVASIAEQIGGSVKDAQKIVDDFYTSFPKVKKWMDETQSFAKTQGYVEDLWGRRRRLPDIQLPKFQVNFKDKSTSTIDFNPLLGSKGLVNSGKSTILTSYLQRAQDCKSRKQVDALKLEALKDNVDLRDNGGFISQAERQCVNARIQGRLTALPL